MDDGTQGRSDLEITARAYSVQQPTSPPSDLHFDGLSAPSIPPRPAHGLHFDRLVPPPAYIRGGKPPVYCSGRPTRWAGYGSVRAPHCASARAASPHKMPSSPLLPSAPMCLFSNLTHGLISQDSAEQGCGEGQRDRRVRQPKPWTTHIQH